jgi:hypothetical protein
MVLAQCHRDKKLAAYESLSIAMQVEEEHNAYVQGIRILIDIQENPPAKR